MSKEQEMLALIEEFESSDLNARVFCRTIGVVPSTFYYWKKKKAQKETPKNGGFIAIRPKTGMDGSHLQPTSFLNMILEGLQNLNH